MEIITGCTCDLNPVPLQRMSAMFFLATTELYSFLVSIPQEKSDKEPWTICQNFCSCYLLGPQKLANIQGVWTVPKKRNGFRNQYLSQTILYTYKKWIEPLFLRRKPTVTHCIDVLLSYLPAKTLLRFFRIVQQAVCTGICSFSFYTMKRNILQRNHL